MIWITVIMAALSLLVEWLISRKKAGGTLSQAEQRRLNGVIYRCHKMESAAIEMGCTPGGEATLEASGEPGPREGTLAERVLALEITVAEMQRLLSDLSTAWELPK